MERIEKLLDMIAQSPNDCFLWHALGLEYRKLDELEKALEAFNKVINTDEKYVGTYYHLAQTLERMNKIDEAIIIYEKGISIANQVKDMHAKNELQMALDDLIL